MKNFYDVFRKIEEIERAVRSVKAIFQNEPTLDSQSTVLLSSELSNIQEEFTKYYRELEIELDDFQGEVDSMFHEKIYEAKKYEYHKNILSIGRDLKENETTMVSKTDEIFVIAIDEENIWYKLFSEEKWRKESLEEFRVTMLELYDIQVVE